MGSYDSLVQTYNRSQAATTFRCLLYGPPGAGKTRLAATFPKPLFVDTDRGMRSIPDGLDVKFLRLPEHASFKTVLDILTDLKNKRGPFAQGGTLADRKTIVIDSISSLADEYLMKEIMVGNKRDPLVENAQRDDYGRLKIELVQLGNLLKDISDSYNVVVTALVDEEKDELTGALEGKPLMTGKYRDIIGAVFDEEYYMECVDAGAGQQKYYLYAARYKWYEAKTRLLKDKKHENATYETLRANFKTS